MEFQIHNMSGLTYVQKQNKYRPNLCYSFSLLSVYAYVNKIVSFCTYTAEEFDIAVYLVYQDISSGDKSTSPVSSSEESNPDPEASAISSEFVVAGSTFIFKKKFEFRATFKIHFHFPKIIFQRIY